MSVTVADRIRDAFPSLPRAERRVAHELLAAYPVAGLETVARLAHRSEVSGPTVIRFTSRLGFDGFPAFQEALLSEIEERNASPLLQFESKVRPGSNVIERSSEILGGGVTLSLEHLDEAAFAATVDRLATTTGRILTAGGRFSEIATLVLAQHLGILRPGIRHIESKDWVTASLDIRRSDTIVLADFRRYQRSTIEFGQEWKRRGAHVIVLTDPWMSPLALEADAVLTAAVDSPSPFDSLLACFAVVETIIAGVVDALGETARDRIADYDALWELQGFAYSGPARDGSPLETS